MMTRSVNAEDLTAGAVVVGDARNVHRVRHVTNGRVFTWVTFENAAIRPRRFRHHERVFVGLPDNPPRGHGEFGK